MFALGTIVNVFAIIIGGVLGLFVARYISVSIQDALMKVNGLATLFLAISSGLPFLSDNKNIIVLLISLALGTLFGEWINLENKLENFGEWLKRKTGSQKDKNFVNAFMMASLTVCIGAMAVMGSLQDGLQNNPSILFAKSILDFTIILVMAGSLGKGVIFSFVPVLIFQGGLTILAGLLAPVFTTLALDYISMVGSVMIFAIGINLIWPGTFKVANQLPGLLIAIIASYL